MQGDQALHRAPAQGAAAAGEHRRLPRRAVQRRQPALEPAQGLALHRHDPLPAALALHAQQTGAAIQIVALEAEQLAQAQARAVEQLKDAAARRPLGVAVSGRPSSGAPSFLGEDGQRPAAARRLHQRRRISARRPRRFSQR